MSTSNQKDAFILNLHYYDVQSIFNEIIKINEQYNYLAQPVQEHGNFEQRGIINGLNFHKYNNVNNKRYPKINYFCKVRNITHK